MALTRAPLPHSALPERHEEDVGLDFGAHGWVGHLGKKKSRCRRVDGQEIEAEGLLETMCTQVENRQKRRVDEPVPVGSGCDNGSRVQVGVKREKERSNMTGGARVCVSVGMEARHAIPPLHAFNLLEKNFYSAAYGIYKKNEKKTVLSKF